MPDIATTPPSSAGHRPLRDRLLPSWLVRCFSRGRASPSAPIASSAIASSTTAPGDDSDGPRPHPRSAASTVTDSPSASPSPSPGKRSGPRAGLSISKLCRRLARALALSSRGSPPTTPCSPEPEPASDALQVPPSSSSTDGADPSPLTRSLIPPPTATASEVTTPSTDVEDAIIHISTATTAVADPMTRMWTEAVAEWQRKTGVDLTAPEATMFNSKENLARYVSEMEAQSRGGTEVTSLRNTLIPLARILAKLCGPIGDTLSSTVFPPSKVIFAAMGLIVSATVQAHEEFELMTEAFDEIRVHLQVVGIVAAHPGTLLYKTSIELLVQVLNVLGVIMKLRHEKYPGRVLRALVEIRPLADSLQGLRRITSRYKEAIVAGTLEVARNIKITNELKRILKWLDFDSVDSSPRMSSLLDERAEGTGLWFFDNRTFVNFLDGQTKVLTIQGKAGCGKSTIIATATRHLRAYCASYGSTHVVLSHFFDSANISRTRDLNAVLSSFLCQLALRDQSCMDVLAKALQRSMSNGCFTRIEKLDTLVGMLNARLQGFLIIDALDEALKHELPKVLHALNKLRSCTNISILVSTRVPLSDEDLQHVVVSLDQVKDNTDVRTALDIELGDTGRLAGIANAKMVRDKLLDRAEGNMRWLTLVVDQLRSAVNDPRKLDRLLDKLPVSLEEMYSNRLDAIRADNIGDTKLLLAWILYSGTHLTTRQLSRMLAFNFNARMPEYKPAWLSPKPDALISGLMDSMFFSIDNGAVRIAHASVREFLVALPPSSPFHTSANDAICLMARTSLAYLLAVSEGIAPAYYHDDLRELWHQRIFVGGHDHYAALKQDIEGVLSRVRASSPPADILSEALGTAIMEGHEGLLLMLLENGASVSDRSCYYTPLELAATCGRVEIVRLLLDKGAQVEDRDENGWTALHIAAQEGQLGIASMLLKHGASVDARTKQQDTPLTIAANNSREDIVRLLLDKGAQVEDRDEMDCTSLHFAARKGHLGITRLLLEQGASVAARTKRQATPLIAAAQCGLEDGVRLILDKGAHVEECNADGWTSLHFAARRGHLGIVTILLERGASISARSSEKTTPLMLAAESGLEDILRLLLDRGAQVAECNQCGWTPLYFAARRGHLGTARLLLERGASISVPNYFGCLPLIAAAECGSEDLVRLLLDRGACVEDRDYRGQTSLHFAACKGNLGTACLLLERGASISARCEQSSTPLIVAAVCGREDVVRLLLDQGAQVEECDNHGWTSLHFAACGGHLGIVTLLLERGASISTRCEQSSTPLMVAADNGREDVVRLLLDKGACVEDRDYRGRTSLHFAAQSERTGIASLLLERGASVDAQDKDRLIHMKVLDRDSSSDAVPLDKGIIRRTVRRTRLRRLSTSPPIPTSPPPLQMRHDLSESRCSSPRL